MLDSLQIVIYHVFKRAMLCPAVKGDSQYPYDPNSKELPPALL